MDTLSDPEQLRGREDVPFREETRTVDPAAFDELRGTVDSHVAVGVTNDAGEVLLMNDGSHGWTLPAFAVDSGADWAVVGRRGLEDLLGERVALERPERVRRVEFRPSDDGDTERRTGMYDVVFRATPVSGRPSADDPALPGEDGAVEVGWFDAVPPEQENGLADDIRLFLD